MGLLSEFSIVILIEMIIIISPVVVMLFKVLIEFKKLRSQADHRQEDIETLFLCMRGCLEGLIELGANGGIKTALNELNKYQAKKTSGRGR
jgi:hypothetical protein